MSCSSHPAISAQPERNHPSTLRRYLNPASPSGGVSLPTDGFLRIPLLRSSSRISGDACLLAVVAVMEGMFACGVRSVRGVVSPLTISPRFAERPDLVFSRMLTIVPNLPSALSTLLVSLEFFRTVAVQRAIPPRGVYLYRVMLMLAIMTVMAVGLWRISIMSVLIIHQTIDLNEQTLAGNPPTTSDFQRVADENVVSTQEVVWLVNGVLSASCALFFSAGLYSIIRVGHAARAGSSALRRSGAGLFAFIVVEFLFSLPVIVNMSYYAGVCALKHTAGRTHRPLLSALFSPSVICSLLPAPPPLLATHRHTGSPAMHRMQPRAQITTACNGRTTPTAPGCGTPSRKAASSLSPRLKFCRYESR